MESVGLSLRPSWSTVGSGLEISLASQYVLVMARPPRIEFPGAVYHSTARVTPQAQISADAVERAVVPGRAEPGGPGALGREAIWSAIPRPLVGEGEHRGDPAAVTLRRPAVSGRDTCPGATGRQSGSQPSDASDPHAPWVYIETDCGSPPAALHNGERGGSGPGGKSALLTDISRPDPTAFEGSRQRSSPAPFEVAAR